MRSLMYRSVAEIDPGLCIKCGKCSRACPEGIIAWAPGSSPRINQGLCTACGLCVAACPRQGAVRIVRKVSMLPLTVLAVFLVILVVSTYLMVTAGYESPAKPLEVLVERAGESSIEIPYASKPVSEPEYVKVDPQEYKPSEKSGG